MAVIRTVLGDLVAPVKVSNDHLMDVAELSFTIAADDSLLTGGALNVWQPVNVRQFDGDPDAILPGGSTVDYTAWVTKLANGNNPGEVAVTAKAGAVWLGRNRKLTRPSSSNASAGAHVADLWATLTNNRERRRPTAYSVAATTAWTPINDLNKVITGAVFTAAAENSGHAASERQIVLSDFHFLTASAPVRVAVTIPHAETNGVTWSATVEASVDGGSTWLTAHAIGSSRGITNPDMIDLTADTTWTAAKLGDDKLRLRLTVTANADTSDIWAVYGGLTIDADADAVTEAPWPIHLGSIDYGGVQITLPDTERKTLREWLDYLADQTGGEWSVTGDFTLFGLAALNWQPQIGSDFSATVTLDGTITQLAALEEGQVIGGLPQVSVDGEAFYSQVRVTATGLADVVVSNDALISQIGLHEYTVDLGPNASATDQANAAAVTLERLGNPILEFQLEIPRIAGLWGKLGLGNTVFIRIQRAPINPWYGVVRIIGRGIDDARGVLTLTTLSVQDRSGRTQPIADGLTVQQSVTTRVAARETHLVRRLKGVLTLAQRQARQ